MRGDAAEEVDHGLLRKEPQQARIHDEDHDREARDDGKTVHPERLHDVDHLIRVFPRNAGDRVSHQAKDADRCHQHGDLDDANNDGVQSVEKVDERLRFVPRNLQQREAEKNRHEHDLQHAAVVAGRCEEVGRHHIHDRLQRAAVAGLLRELLSLLGVAAVCLRQRLLHLGRHVGAGFDGIDQKQADNQRDDGRADVKSDRLPANPRQLGRIGQ